MFIGELGVRVAGRGRGSRVRVCGDSEEGGGGCYSGDDGVVVVVGVGGEVGVGGIDWCCYDYGVVIEVVGVGCG